MKTRIIHIVTLFLLAASLASAQQAPTPPPAGQPGPDPLGQSFFPPELVIQNQQAIGLSDEQKNYLRTEIRDAQLKFTDLQWKLQDEAEKMVELARQPHVDEQQALAQLEKVLSLEREVKRAQITLLVHIKNKLTPEQQAKLEGLRGRPR
jgi:Spy/CpxP family protein refolding chaperone